jgi:hypothetical protein
MITLLRMFFLMMTVMSLCSGQYAIGVALGVMYGVIAYKQFRGQHS